MGGLLRRAREAKGLHIAVLALGAVAALVATRLHRRVGWLALPLLAMAVIDALAGSGAPERARLL